MKKVDRISKKLNVVAIAEPHYSFCSKGHRVTWYIQKPHQCPRCKTALLPNKRKRRNRLTTT